MRCRPPPSHAARIQGRLVGQVALGATGCLFCLEWLAIPDLSMRTSRRFELSCPPSRRRTAASTVLDFVFYEVSLVSLTLVSPGALLGVS